MSTPAPVLMPCPFCGGANIRIRCAAFLGDQKSYVGTCEGCYSQSQLATSEAEAIAAWNRRTPLARREALEEAAKAVIEFWSKLHGDAECWQGVKSAEVIRALKE